MMMRIRRGSDYEEETEKDEAVPPQHGHTLGPGEGNSDEEDIPPNQSLTKRSKRRNELVLAQQDISDPIRDGDV